MAMLPLAASIGQPWRRYIHQLRRAQFSSCSDKWKLSLAILLASASAATTASKTDHDESCIRKRVESINDGCIIGILNRLWLNQQQVRCETQNYRLPGNIARDSIKDSTQTHQNHSTVQNSRQQRKIIQSIDRMAQKYKIDYNTVLGEGSYGIVYPAHVILQQGTDKCLVATEQNSDGFDMKGEDMHRMNVALKKISKTNVIKSASSTSEIDALLRIFDCGGHPNISGLRDIYEDESYYYLFLDLAKGGEMFDQLIQHGQYSEYDASRLVTEILSALAFLHNIGVVHADLKPENILLCSKTKGAETIKLIDFGCASIDERGTAHVSERNSSNIKALPSIGTKAYWSPERFQKHIPITDAVDMYAVGIILFIMLVGVHPFDVAGSASDEEIEEQIKNGGSLPMALTSHLSPSARDFIKGLMERDPNRRLTAITALQHPWIRGVTPTFNAIQGSDTKLIMYQELRDKLASGIFAALVDGENLRNSKRKSNDENEQSLTHLLKQAFEVFDEEGKGYVSRADVGRVMTKVMGESSSSYSSVDMIKAVKGDTFHDPPQSEGLSLSDFSRLFSRLRHEHFRPGEYIFHPGDVGDKMYFINSGKVEILTKSGHLVSILRHGDFFGEGSLLVKGNQRTTAAKCSTPVELIAVSKEDFEKYLESSSTKRSIKRKWNDRTFAQAKKLIGSQTHSLTKRHLNSGDAVYHEGDVSNSMFLVVDGNLDVTHNGNTLHNLSPGDSFGESSLLFRRSRSSTVVCMSASCTVHEMKDTDFFALLASDPTHAQAINDMCRKRMFHKAMKIYLLSSGLDANQLEKAFHDVDNDGSGTLSLTEVRELMLHNMGGNSSISDNEVRELLDSLDLDGDGQVTLIDVIETVKSLK